MSPELRSVTPELSRDRPYDVIVVGGGQAGLAIAWYLAELRLRFVVLDAGPEVGHAWRSRWDSLTLFTPARYDALPGTTFPGPADAYPGKDTVAEYLQAYAAAADLPVRLDARVTRLERTEGGFEVCTGGERLHAQQVVVATGPFQVPFVPPAAGGLDGSVTQLHSAAYLNPQALPDGPVLVVGGGNSGFQIAEELAVTRRVDLALGQSPPTLPQRLLGRDLFWWLTRLGLMRVPGNSRLGRRVRARGEVVIGTSRRKVRRAGIRVRPRMVGGAGRLAHFSDGGSLEVGTVVWATGYRPDYSWIDIPGVIDDGRVVHRRGVTDVPALYFLGLPWQHTRGSALLGFVDEDAAHIARAIHAYPTAARAEAIAR